MIKIACHQPNFFPHLGFFKKMFISDIFVILDDVQFSRRSYTQRTLIKIQNSGKWLTVPVIKKGRYYQKVMDVEIDNTRNWKKDHLRTFQVHYKNASFFEEVFNLLSAIYGKDWEYLIDLNMFCIQSIMEYLGIMKRIVYSSSLNIRASGSERILSIVKKLDGDVYISGRGGEGYLDMERFRSEGIDVRFYEYPGEYNQMGFGFIKGLSIIDALFNVGKGVRRLIET